MGFAIRDGLLLGITLATLFGFGPALLALLQTSLNKGFKSGFALAFGIFLSDLFLVLLSFEGVIQIVEEPKNKLAFGIVGGVILIVFGTITAIRKPQIVIQEIEIKNPRAWAYIFKGFFLNVANPFIWIFWMGTMIAVTANYQKEEDAILLMFAITLLTVFISDSLKAYLAGKLKPLITENLLKWINYIAGIGLVIFGISLIIRAFYF
jgi:threonine/homoserine/homoserine lactone efflux protein